MSTSQFGMNITPEAFKIFSSQVYQYKIAAVVREYACNACDSHIQASNPKPFSIILPTTEYPFFAVQDYGLGLDDHGVRTIFSTYFQSTKRSDNEATGFLGIGSKSAYSYTSEFFIEAVKDGTYRKYRAFFDESDTPALDEVACHSTTDANGVKVSFAVKPEDYSRFHADASFIASFLTITPDVINGDVWDAGIADQLKEKGWATSDKEIPSAISSLYAIGFDCIAVVMGGVVYPITNYEARQLMDSDYYKNFIYRMNRKLFIRAENGELEFAASRETLSMTEATISKLKSLIKDAIDSIIEDVQNDIDSTNHIVEAYKITNTVLGFVPNGMEWKGSMLVNAERNMLSFLNRMGIRAIQRMGSVNNSDLCLHRMYGKVTFFEKDTSKTGAIKHSKDYMTDNEVTGIGLVAKKKMSPQRIKRLKHIFGIEETVKQSEIIPEKKRSRSGNRISSTQIRGKWINIRSYSVYSGHFGVIDSSTVMETEGYRVAYAKRVRDDIVMCQSDNNMVFHIDLYESSVRGVVASLGIDRVIYKTTQNEKKIEKLNIPSLEQCINDYVKEHELEIRRIQIAAEAHKVFGVQKMNFLRFLKKIESPTADGLMSKEDEDVVLLLDRTVTDRMSALLGFIERPQEVEDARKRFYDAFLKFDALTKNRYPYLPDRYHWREGGDEEEYIKAMDLYWEMKLIEEM